jgi:hypothetical protein
MSDGLTIQKDDYGNFRVLYRGKLASSGFGAMSWFKRKRDAQSFVNYLRFLFGERLELASFHVTTEEMLAMDRAIEELNNK